MWGKRAIGGGRRALRHVLFQTALVASRHNPVPKTFADRLRGAGKPLKAVITAVARKLVTIVNAFCKARRKWARQPAREVQFLDHARHALELQQHGRDVIVKMIVAGILRHAPDN